jgi:Glycosyl hydrolases family 8
MLLFGLKMKRQDWKYLRFGLVAGVLIETLVACNSHLLLKSQDPEVVVSDPPVVKEPPKVTIDDAGIPPDPWTTITLVGPDNTPEADAAPPAPGTDAPVVPPGPDAAKIPDAPPDLPTVENLSCPTGMYRVHVRDIWSNTVDPPSLKTMTNPPLEVQVIDPSSWATYGARQDAANCSYYSVCLSTSITKIMLKAMGADGCATGDQSGTFDLSSFKNASDVWIEYGGDDTNIRKDFTASPPTTGTNAFHITSDSKTLKYAACKVGTPPNQTVPDGYTKVHFRWPWNDPTNPATPYPGSGCPASTTRDPTTKACPFALAQTLGATVPPYPSSLKVTGLTCEMVAVLEFQDGQCPWYYVLVPNAAWPTTGTAPKIVFRYPDESKNLYTNSIQLPARTANEYWVAYAGAPDNTIASVTCCMDWSLQTNSYFIYTANPGPGYQNCGGQVAPVDPCSPPQPSGYHTVHFRYLWAGQKTFTFFPSLSLMPKWMELEVNGTGNALKVICQREQDRPWYECPVPDSAFGASTTWRAVDKLHNPEWNTVKPWPLPPTPKEYWIRWYYGKPDIPRSVDPPNFKVFDYYPDGSNGDWSATGNWNDSMCAPKPPATPVTVGFGNGAWFPYKSTQYKYPYGGSLAYVYPKDNQTKVQDLLDAFVVERYNLWKQNWVLTDTDACGNGTARVYSDNPAGTVSEGQGYGLAISAAIGDKDMVDKLWNFVRHYRSQQRYCGLMGWMFQTTADCQPLDSWATGAGNHDSAFDGDVDIGIGLVFAALQWPNDYGDIAVDWLTRMECEVNAKYGDGYNYPSKGDTWNKNCQDANHCDYDNGTASEVFIDYYPPGYFRVFGDFLATKLGSDAKAANGQSHHDFWYKTAETTWELVERCYDVKGVHPGLMGNTGDIKGAPCSQGGGQPYEWGRALWRLGIDGAWFGNNTSLPENTSNSSRHYSGKSRIQAKLDNIMDFYANFYKKNPPEANANRFSTICDQMGTDGTVSGGAAGATGCDPAYGHNSYTVNLAMAPFTTRFDDGGAISSDIRREALEESVSTTVQNDHYFQESLGVYSILFLTGNFPNPMTVPTK